MRVGHCRACLMSIEVALGRVINCVEESMQSFNGDRMSSGLLFMFHA